MFLFNCRFGIVAVYLTARPSNTKGFCKSNSQNKPSLRRANLFALQQLVTEPVGHLVGPKGIVRVSGRSADFRVQGLRARSERSLQK